MFNTILFATDLGPFTDYCLQYAAELAAKCNGRLVIVHAVEPLGGLARAVVATYIEDGPTKAQQQVDTDTMLDSIRSRILEALTYDYASTEVDLARVAAIKVVQGKAAEVILAEAGACQASLIVMGSHGAETLNSNLIGSVTSKVLQLSKVPVLMVPMMNPHNLHARRGVAKR